MSLQSLKKSLQEEIEELEIRNEVYRKNKSDMKIHYFHVNKKKLFSAIKIQLEKQAKLPINILNSKALTTLIDDSVELLFDKIFKYAKKNNVSIEVITDEYFIVKTIKKQKLTGYENVSQASVFNFIKNTYNTTTPKIVGILNEFIEQNLGDSNLLSTQEFLDLSHIDESAITRKRLAISKRKIVGKVKSLGITEKHIKELGLDATLYFGKDDTLNITKIHVDLDSAFLNRTEGRQLLAQMKSDRLKKLKADKQKLESMATLSSSDSRMTIEKKKQIKSFIDKVKKDKKLKVSSIDTKIKLANNKKVKAKLKKRKITKITSELPNFPELKLQVFKQVSQPVLNLNALKAQINARLSMTVIKNMGTPALENRTGRFARSVQVTDITQTSQGFPSIGYTYDKYPYQTFEPGFKQGSTQRDPRKLIDRSIRDIASELLVGRFYTRRA